VHRSKAATHVRFGSRAISGPVFDLDQRSFPFMSICLDATISRWRPKGRSSPMTIQSDNTKGRSLADNFWAQLGLLMAVLVIVIAFAWQYVW
jgi:hypothetical protein